MMQDSYRPFGNAECLDVFTHYAALEYLKTKKPKVLYISYGETDEWAHHGYYRSYLDAAHLVDKWIKRYGPLCKAIRSIKIKRPSLLLPIMAEGYK